MKVRIKFSRDGAMKFVGHLDLMRYFQKAMRRANVNIRYSEGFSPHQVMSFAAPLGVGIASRGEYLDIEVAEGEETDREATGGAATDRKATSDEMAGDVETNCGMMNRSPVSSESMRERLNRVMVDGIRVLSCRRLADSGKPAMSLVCAADYSLGFREGHEPDDREDFFGRLERFYGQERILISKQTKRSQIELDLKPLVYRLERRGDGIFMQVCTGSTDHVKPELVMEEFFREQQWEYPKFAFQIQREEVYGRDASGNRIPLEEFGEDIE